METTFHRPFSIQRIVGRSILDIRICYTFRSPEFFGVELKTANNWIIEYFD